MSVRSGGRLAFATPSSAMASTTSCLSATSSSAVDTRTRCRTSAAELSLPRSSALRRDRSSLSWADSAAFEVLSTTITSHPARAETWAMPDPMRPLPMTAISLDIHAAS